MSPGAGLRRRRPCVPLLLLFLLVMGAAGLVLSRRRLVALQELRVRLIEEGAMGADAHSPVDTPLDGANHVEASDGAAAAPHDPPDGPSPHYNLSAEVMPAAFREHLAFMASKIARRWGANGWKRFDKTDVAACLQSAADGGTPECGLWDLIRPDPPQGVSGPAADAYVLRPLKKCCAEHQLLKKTALFATDLLRKHNISYFLSTGSALGAVRHGGTIIPWDTDVDIAIFPNDTDRAKAAFKAQRKHFFSKDPNGKPMFWVHASSTGRPVGGPHVEIFVDPVYTAYPAQLLPLRPCDFYGHAVSCPNRRMFDVWFPSGWHTYGGCHYHGKSRGTVYIKGERREVAAC